MDEFGTPGESIPVVTASDLKTLWTHRHEGYGQSAYRDLFNPTSDTMALGYRCLLLSSMEPLWAGGQPSEDAFEAAATVTLDYPPRGVQKGLLLSVDRLVEEVKIRQFKAANKVGS